VGLTQVFGDVVYGNNQPVTIVTNVTASAGTHHIGLTITGGSINSGGTDLTSHIFLRSSAGSVSDLTAFGSKYITNISAYFYQGHLCISFTLDYAYSNAFF